MKPVRIGLVVEGVTDYIVIKSLFQEGILTLRPGTVLEFIEIQPQIDATSSEASGGGWTQVYSWCLRNPPEMRASLFLGKPLFSDSVERYRCDILVFVLDSDASVHIATKSSVAAPPPPPAPQARGEFIRNTLTEWLWPNGNKQEERHVLVAAVEAIEVWLIAAFCENETPEQIIDVNRGFIDIYYPALGKIKPPTVKRVGKSISNYQKITNRACPNIDLVNARCHHFCIAVNEIAKCIDIIL